MNIIVFGATGQTGLILVNRLLEDHHDVKAYVRNPDKIMIEHSQLTVIKGSVLDADQVSEAMKDQQVVVSCLGGDGNKKSTILTDMTKTIVDAMKKNNIDRIAYIATAGIHDEMPGLLTKIIINLLFKNVINDHKGATKYLMNHQLNYTIARPLSLVEGPLTKTYRKTLEGIPKSGKNISREDLADFLITAIENNEYCKTSVGLAY